MLGTLLNNLPVALLVEGAVFLTLAIGVRMTRRGRRPTR